MMCAAGCRETALQDRGAPSWISSLLVYAGNSPMLSRVPGGIARPLITIASDPSA